MKKAQFLFISILCILFLLIAVSTSADGDPYLSSTSINLKVGDAAKIQIENAPENAITWSSSNENIARVMVNDEEYGYTYWRSELGYYIDVYIRAFTPGSATITAHIEGYGDLTATVTVSDVKIAADISMQMGESRNISLGLGYIENGLGEPIFPSLK